MASGIIYHALTNADIRHYNGSVPANGSVSINTGNQYFVALLATGTNNNSVPQLFGLVGQSNLAARHKAVTLIAPVDSTKITVTPTDAGFTVSSTYTLNSRLDIFVLCSNADWTIT